QFSERVAASLMFPTHAGRALYLGNIYIDADESKYLIKEIWILTGHPNPDKIVAPRRSWSRVIDIYCRGTQQCGRQSRCGFIVNISGGVTAGHGAGSNGNRGRQIGICSRNPCALAHGVLRDLTGIER
ncbi:MAG TPA: hypothetical protein VJQ55_16235, partial [Candidatus Binatia bacterium]|nr:hypothetical protein [Candidatus Binatia bacterium]